LHLRSNAVSIRLPDNSGRRISNEAIEIAHMTSSDSPLPVFFFQERVFEKSMAGYAEMAQG